VAAPHPFPGYRIVVASWIGNAAFAATAIPAALGVEALDAAAIGVALGLFAISLGVWGWAFAVALARTTRGDDVVVGSMFLLQGPVPGRVRLHLFGSLGVCLAVTAATAAAEPFGVLVPMLPLGLAGLWGARHGTYPPRRVPRATPGGRMSSGRASQ
jgi:cadmium resistance protein CadD (predicted permease)